MEINFDNYSLIIDGERKVIKSAAFHYFRCPGEELWIDRLSKLKAGGYNTVDLYFCWNYHSEKEGEYDFSGIRDINRLLKIAKELGLFVIARPGPYINAEVSAGGLPLWLLNKENIIPRNRKNGDYIYSQPYMDDLKEWYGQIIPIINRFDNVIAFQIENEYSTNEAEYDYMQELYNLSREMGIKAPIFHNDAYSAGLYADVIDIYACDIYPYITPDQDWKSEKYAFDTLDNLEENIKPCKPDAPIYIAEMQAGWFDKYFGTGNEHIRNHLGDEHINIMTKTALSQGITMFNHYMGCGGTSWDNIGCDEVYTSYDFASPIDENGLPQANFYKAKEINYLLDGFDFSKTEFEAKNEDLFDNNVEEHIFGVLRDDKINLCKWLFVRSLNDNDVELNLKNSNKFTLKPFEMKIFPLGLPLKAATIDFSTSELFSRVAIDTNEIVLFIASQDSLVELSGIENAEFSENLKVSHDGDKAVIRIENAEDSNLGSAVFSKDGKVTKIIFLNKQTADKTWIVDKKIIVGPDFLFSSSNNNDKISLKGAFSESIEFQILDINKGFDWSSSGFESPSDRVVPVIEKYTNIPCSPEIDETFDYSSWEKVTKTDCISNEINDEFIWYKGKFEGSIDEIFIQAKHCFAIYINGKKVFEQDSYVYDNLIELEEELSLEIKNIEFKQVNEITVLCQNLGFDKGFSNDTNMPRGLISFRTVPSKDIQWSVKNGLTPERANWNTKPYSQITPSAKNDDLYWISTEFKLEKFREFYSPLYVSFENSTFDRAIINLNGNKIGRYWKTVTPQEKFYLIESFLQEYNRLSIVVWFKNCQIQQTHDFNFCLNNVNITIGTFGNFSALELDKLI